MKKLNEHSVSLALSRMLEFLDDGPDFQPWCESIGIDYEFMQELAAMMAEEREDDFNPSSFINGIVLAWEVARIPEAI